MTTYVLKPRLPVRAFLVSAVLTMVGAGLLVAALSSRWHIAAVVAAAVVLAAGVVLLAMALISMRTLRMKITFDDDGYRIKGPGSDVTGAWRDVTKVVQTDEGARLVFHHGEVRRTHLWCPGGADDPQMQALTADLGRRLDHSRGLTNLIVPG
ncbi:hypothetical protein [Aestuariimicrobium ganziense]|uniref:hypothetical protein n=1 Tax=Aestuariimicrobium ganziense TaxID=2773677 RepID=UPI00194291B9|nr:hypothetical protein [Aestuariimicrobium ganziense]